MSVSPSASSGSRDILAILPAAGIRAVGGRDEEEDVAHAVSTHGRDGVLQKRVPVAVAEVDRQVDAVLGQLAFERGDQAPGSGR